MNRKSVVEKVAEMLHKVAPDCTSILYGSEARGEARPDSDVDVLVIMPDDEDSYAARKIEITESLYDVELATGITISPLIVMKSAWERLKTPFTCNVAKDGILI